MGKMFAPVWRDDDIRWTVTTGTVLNILDNHSKDTSRTDPLDEGMMPTQLIAEVIRVSRKYGESSSPKFQKDAGMLITHVPPFMALMSALANEKKVTVHTGIAPRNPVPTPLLEFTSSGKLRLTIHGKDELNRIYAEFSRKIAASADKKLVDMNDPMLEWEPPKGWGITPDFNDKLPLLRESRTRMTYRQWLTMIYRESRIYVAAKEDLMMRGNVPAGSKEDEKRVQGIKSRHAQIKNVRIFAKIVLGGGPEGVWVGKPLQPKDVHNDVESFFAAGKSGFTSQMIEASSLAWELWETDKTSMTEYAEIQDWCRLEKTEISRFSEYDKLKDDEDERPDSDFPKYKHIADRHPEASGKQIARYDPLGVNLPMDFAASRVVQQVTDPGSFGVIRSDGTMEHTRCDYHYGADPSDPGFIPHSRKAGARCSNIAVAGTTRCEMHGGLMASPAETRSMIVSSQLQMFAMSSEAMKTIADIMINGQNEATRLRAAETILNRSGIVEGAEVDTSGAAGRDPSAGKAAKEASDIVMARLKRLAQYEENDNEPEPVKVEASPSHSDDIIDGEIVDLDEKQEKQ